MNHFSCLVCDRSAARVCIHPNCQKIPFVCGDKCKHDQNMAVSLHTHDGVTQFMPFEDMLTKVSSIQYFSHWQHTNIMRKRVNLIIGDLGQLMKRYEDELNRLVPKLSTRAKGIIECVNVKERGKYLKGKDLSELMFKGEIYENQREYEIRVDKVKKEMEKVMQKLEGLGLKNILTNTVNSVLYLQKQKGDEHFNKGENLRLHGMFKEALEEFKLARQPNPASPQYIYRIIHCYAELNDLEQALKHHEEFVSMGGKGESVPKSYNNIGNIYYRRGDFAKAIQYYSKAIELKNDYADCYCNRGVAYEGARNYDQAIKDYTKAIQIDGEAPLYYNNRGNLFYNIDNYEQAIKDQTKAIQLNSREASYYNNRGNSLFSMGKYQEAAGDYTNAIQIDDRKSEYYNSRGNAFFHLGNYQQLMQAIVDYTKAIELSSGDPKYFNNRAQAYSRLGMYSEAIEDYTRAINVLPLKGFYLGRAVCFQKTGQFVNAKSDKFNAIRAPER